jgi:hypothetical protein
VYEIFVADPPIITEIFDQNVEEGALFQMSCPVVTGNPSKTEFNWTSQDGQLISEKQILSITNVSRNDDMQYTCTVFNTMTPTGLPSVQGVNNESFHLNVECMYK